MPLNPDSRYRTRPLALPVGDAYTPDAVLGTCLENINNNLARMDAGDIHGRIVIDLQYQVP